MAYRELTEAEKYYDIECFTPYVCKCCKKTGFTCRCENDYQAPVENHTLKSVWERLDQKTLLKTKRRDHNLFRKHERNTLRMNSSSFNMIEDPHKKMDSQSMNETFMMQVASKDDYRVRENVKKLLDNNSIYNAHITRRHNNIQTPSNGHGNFTKSSSNLYNKNKLNAIYEAFDRKEPKIKNISVTHEEMMKGFQTENQNSKNKFKKLLDASTYENAKTKRNMSEISNENLKMKLQPLKRHEIEKYTTYTGNYNQPIPVKIAIPRLAKLKTTTNLRCLSHFTEESNNRRSGKNKFFDESAVYSKNVDFYCPHSYI